MQGEHCRSLSGVPGATSCSPNSQVRHGAHFGGALAEHGAEAKCPAGQPPHCAHSRSFAGVGDLVSYSTPATHSRNFEHCRTGAARPAKLQGDVIHSPAGHGPQSQYGRASSVAASSTVVADASTEKIRPGNGTRASRSCVNCSPRHSFNCPSIGLTITTSYPIETRRSSSRSSQRQKHAAAASQLSVWNTSDGISGTYPFSIENGSRPSPARFETGQVVTPGDSVQPFADERLL